MSKFTSCLFAGLAMASVASQCTANATTVPYATATALAANSTATTTINFNGGSGETYYGNAWTTSGVTFGADSGVFHIRTAAHDAAYHPNGYVDLQGSTLSMNFGTAVTSVGFDFGDFYSSIVNLSITLGNGDMFNVSSPSNAYGYFGVTSNVAFNSLTITTNNLYTGFDNVTFGAAAVPEPASLALLGVGLFGFAAARRKNAK